ncbi:hypothetical protein PG985_005256 [Apiospora marii]|uniref:Uncharacterized protein n=1 Tax=Apiospora marii TaxID=335849 RepID=A0ABR1SBF8_9PEZI
METGWDNLYIIAIFIIRFHASAFAAAITWALQPSLGGIGLGLWVLSIHRQARPEILNFPFECGYFPGVAVRLSLGESDDSLGGVGIANGLVQCALGTFQELLVFGDRSLLLNPVRLGLFKLFLERLQISRCL